CASVAALCACCNCCWACWDCCCACCSAASRVCISCMSCWICCCCASTACFNCWICAFTFDCADAFLRVFVVAVALLVACGAGAANTLAVNASDNARAKTCFIASLLRDRLDDLHHCSCSFALLKIQLEHAMLGGKC